MDGADEMYGAPVAAFGEAAEVPELAGATFDAVAVPTGEAVMRDGDLATAVGRDSRFGTHAGDWRSQGIAVVA